MSLIVLKTFHYLAILFAGGVLVGGGLIQAVFTRANQVPDINVSRVLKVLGYLGLVALIILWITSRPLKAVDREFIYIFLFLPETPETPKSTSF